MWQYGGETNLLRSVKVAGVTCDQNYCYVDYPTIIKKNKLNGFGTKTYTVKSGDTLTAIAKANNTTVDKIVSDNKLIQSGMVLKV